MSEQSIVVLVIAAVLLAAISPGFVFMLILLGAFAWLVFSLFTSSVGVIVLLVVLVLAAFGAGRISR